MQGDNTAGDIRPLPHGCGFFARIYPRQRHAPLIGDINGETLQQFLTMFAAARRQVRPFLLAAAKTPQAANMHSNRVKTYSSSSAVQTNRTGIIRCSRLARRGGTSQWSSTKTARPGDRVLIYIQQPHSALIAEAEVLTDPVKGEPGDYAYRAKIGNFNCCHKDSRSVT